MKQKIKKIKLKRRALYCITFLLGFQSSLAVYIFSSFFKERTGLGNIGIFFILAYIASFYILINLHHLIKKYGRSNILLLFMIMESVTLLGLGVYSQSMWSIIFAVWSITNGVLMWASLDSLIERFSQDQVTGKIRGIQLTSMSVGFILGPFFATWLIERLNFGAVFIVAAVVVIFATILVFLNFRKINHEVKKDSSIATIVGKILQRKDLLRIYYVSFVLELFYCCMSIYIPLYLLNIGFSWMEIGKIITVMLIPFILLQWPLGIVADVHIGEKEWLFWGIIIIALTTGAMSFIGKASIVLWMVVLFLSRIGAAIIQVMRDTYFYKKIDSQDVDFIDFFRTTKSVGFVFGTAFFSIFLIIFPLKMIFLMLGILLFTALAPVLKLHDTR